MAGVVLGVPGSAAPPPLGPRPCCGLHLRGSPGGAGRSQEAAWRVSVLALHLRAAWAASLGVTVLGRAVGGLAVSASGLVGPEQVCRCRVSGLAPGWSPWTL